MIQGPTPPVDVMEVADDRLLAAKGLLDVDCLHGPTFFSRLMAYEQAAKDADAVMRLGRELSEECV